MSSSQYIAYPITVEYQDVLQDAYTYIQSKFPNWLPADGNLDTATLQAWANEAAQLRELASAVPDAIFRVFGSTLMQFPPIDATPASVNSTWTMVDNAGYTIPAGTLVAIMAAGDQPVPFQVASDIVVLPGSTVTATGQVTLVALQDGAAASGIGGTGQVVQLVDSLAFVSGITMTSATSGGVDAETNDEYFSRLKEHLQLLAPRLILPSDFAIAAKANGAYRALGIDGYNPVHNLLTADEASFETSVANWGGTTNCAVAQTAAQAADGTHSMSMTAASAANMSTELTAAAGKACVANDVISGLASFRAAATGRVVKVGLQFLDFGGSNLGITYGTTVSDVTTGWTQATVQATAPVGAVKVCLIVFVTSPANTEVHYVDKTQIRRAAGVTDWVAGGTGETSQPRSVSIAAVDSSGNPLGSTVKAAILAYAQAQREAGFLVSIIDPNVQNIDVNYVVTALPGYDTTILTSSINAALSAFLSKSVWGIDPGVRDQTAARTWVNLKTVRYQDVANILKNVEGVDHYTTLQIAYAGGPMGTADLPLAGVAPLANIGTITGVVG